MDQSLSADNVLVEALSWKRSRFMTTIDFGQRLHDYVTELQLPFPVILGVLDRENFVTLYPLPRSKVVRKYYNKYVERQLDYEFNIKTEDQVGAIRALSTLSTKLQQVKDVPSENNSYQFQKIKVANKSSLVGQDEHGFFFYKLTIEVLLITYT